MLGAHAEFAKVPASRLVKIPSEVSFEEAATAMIQGMTAHYLVYTTGRLKPGDKVLIHAAAGGTGSLVCQVAKNAGNRSITNLRGDTSVKNQKHSFINKFPSFWQI